MCLEELLKGKRKQEKNVQILKRFCKFSTFLSPIEILHVFYLPESDKSIYGIMCARLSVCERDNIKTHEIWCMSLYAKIVDFFNF